MNITNIKESSGKYDFDLFNAIQSESKPLKNEENIDNKSNAPVSWQKDILLDALKTLENNIQLDNSNPLDRTENSPIESFSEAQIELNFIDAELFRKEGLEVHSNLNYAQVAYLFVNEI